MSDVGTIDEATTIFDDHRRLLLGVAYRVLGQWTEAEDVVQDAWLRWRDVDHTEVENPRAYLVQVTTRLSIDQLRRAKTRRETYVGEWLPEPVLTDKHSLTDKHELADPDVADQVVRADSVSLAMLVVLETLSPLERAVFVLREAFDFSYAEIAAILDKAEPAVRQLASRARAHVEARKPRFDADQRARREAAEKFMAAAATGRIEDLLALLSPDVELHSDGGGIVRAPKRIIIGADKVSRFFVGIADKGPDDSAMYAANVNGQSALVITSYGKPYVVLSFEVRDGQIAGIHLMGNPEKLGAVDGVADVGTPLDIELPTAPAH